MAEKMNQVSSLSTFSDYLSVYDVSLHAHLIRIQAFDQIKNVIKISHSHISSNNAWVRTEMNFHPPSGPRSPFRLVYTKTAAMHARNQYNFDRVVYGEQSYFGAVLRKICITVIYVLIMQFIRRSGVLV